MKIYAFISVCFYFTTAWTSEIVPLLRNTSFGRIVGGQEANAGMFPFVAAVYVTTSTSRFFCGGALLGDQWIITAAQCVDQAVSFTVQLGSVRLNDDDLNREILATSNYFIHPDYNPETLDNDVGIIKLRMPVEFTDYIKPVYTIAVDSFPGGFQFLALGWGHTTDDDLDLTEVLNWVSLTTLTNDECKITYGNQITENMICVAGNYNEGSCIGDTGSPLVYLIKYGAVVLQGVASFLSGNGCESPDPSGYTRLFMQAHWIVNVTGVPLG